MSNETKFKEGDIVEWCGVRGKVITIPGRGIHPVVCGFENETVASFTYDGKYMDWHKEPSLKLIEQPKKKVKKYMVVYKRHYSNFSISFNVSDDFYYSQKDFENQHPCSEFICLIKESEIEVEEEE